MKIDKSKLSALSAMGDEELWRQIRAIASAYGITLPEKAPPSQELSRVRSAFNGERLNLCEAVNAIKSYKGRNENGNGC